MIRVVVIFIFLLTFNLIFTQNKQVLFGFKDVPQTLMTNPGSEVLFEKHIGFPLLSGFSLEANSKGLSVYDLFADNGVDINDKLRSLIFNLSTNDHISINQQLELINFGFKSKNGKDYLSFGIYQELDFINYYPKDAAILFYQGNTDENGTILLNRPYDMNHISIKGELISVIHAGISRKINKKLTLGARAKLYSGAYNISSTNNKGTLTTIQGTDNTYQHQFRNVNAAVRTSGVIDNDDLSENLVSTTLNNLFFSGNLGLGLDLGFTYRYEDDITFTASLLDLGFVSYSKGVNTHKLKGDYDLDGIGLLFPPSSDDRIDYWDALLTEFDEALNRVETSTTYVTMRPVKLNVGATYQFGDIIERRTKRRGIPCPTEVYDTKFRENEVGVQLYSVFRTKQPQVALSAFYYRRITDFLRAKITYTADSYSLSNIGLGSSIHVRNFNFYTTIDNILGYSDISKSNSVSVQFGFNWMVD